MDTSVEIKTPPSRHYFYRKATQPEQTTSPTNINNNVFLNGLDNSNAFENRVNDFVERSTIKSCIEKIRKNAKADLTRRKADRKARKEKEEQMNGALLHIPSTTTPTTSVVASETLSPTADHETTSTKIDNEHKKPLFEKLNSLSVAEQNAWLANIYDDAMLMNPHQWLKLASLFNVNAKAARQQTLINFESLKAVLEDRSITESEAGSLENFLELRDIQNRNYARDAVTEGVKLIKQNRVKEAMEFYKRALDMDPKYAEGWFHVAEGLVQQRKLIEAADHLERVLKLDPTHEGAKALLANINHTANPRKSEKGDEWDIVDEHGESLSRKITENKLNIKDGSDDGSPNRNKKKRSYRRSRSQEERRKRNRSDRDTERDRDRGRGRDRDRDRDRDRGRDRDRTSERDRDKTRDHDRSRDHDRTRNHDRTKDRDRIRDKVRDRDRARNKERDNRRFHPSRDRPSPRKGRISESPSKNDKSELNRSRRRSKSPSTSRCKRDDSHDYSRSKSAREISCDDKKETSYDMHSNHHHLQSKDSSHSQRDKSQPSRTDASKETISDNENDSNRSYSRRKEDKSESPSRRSRRRRSPSPIRQSCKRRSTSPRGRKVNKRRSNSPKRAIDNRHQKNSSPRQQDRIKEVKPAVAYSKKKGILSPKEDEAKKSSNKDTSDNIKQAETRKIISIKKVDNE